MKDRPPLPDDSVAARSARASMTDRTTWVIPRLGAIEGVGPPRLLAVVVVLGCVLVAPRSVRGQLSAPEPPSPSMGPTPSLSPTTADPTVPAPGPSPEALLLDELRRLRADVSEMQALREEVTQMRGELEQMRQVVGASNSGPTATVGPPMGLGAVLPGTEFDLAPDHYHAGPTPINVPDRPNADRDPIVNARYRYHHDATGPLGGGGYFGLTTSNDEFTLNLSNQITVDGTFIDRQNMPTIQQGFNIPFNRNYIYGNITRDWSYQVGTQGFLGTFNLLDAWLAWHINDLVTLRAGKGLAPPLYEYYAFSPALEPVITNSPLFQLAAKRPIGIMFTGALLDDRIQWWSGVNNTGSSTFGALDRNAEFNGAVTLTPFRGDRWDDTIWEGLGGGIGFSAGQQDYRLDQTSIALTNNGEATTNPSFVTVLGIPWYVYEPGVRADGMRTRVSPHLFWFGRFSILAEYMNHSRELAFEGRSSRSTQRAYYVNASYWLTGERDYRGNGFQGYSTIEPIRPLVPSRGQFGPGAWQLAAQWSEFNAGAGDIRRGFVVEDRSTERMQNFMTGVNWWPNKYTRLSFDYVWTWFNDPILINGPTPIDRYQTFWMRFAMFF